MVNFNIGLNRLIKMKIKTSIILQDLKISQKLLKIFTFVLSTNLGVANQ